MLPVEDVMGVVYVFNLDKAIDVIPIVRIEIGIPKIEVGIISIGVWPASMLDI